MNEDTFRIMDLSMQGFQCSQILVLMALEAQQRRDPDLIRAMTGLVGGMGCGKTCGALTAGCCVLGLYAGKDSADKDADERLQGMLTQFVEWFEAEYAARYGGINCNDIVRDDMRNRAARCPTIVIESLAKVKELLAENGYDFSKPIHQA